MSTPRVVRVVLSNNNYKYKYYYTPTLFEIFELYTSIIRLHSRSKSLVLIPYLGAAAANRNKHRLVNFEIESAPQPPLPSLSDPSRYLQVRCH